MGKQAAELEQRARAAKLAAAVAEASGDNDMDPDEAADTVAGTLGEDNQTVSSSADTSRSSSIVDPLAATLVATHHATLGTLGSSTRTLHERAASHGATLTFHHHGGGGGGGFDSDDQLMRQSSSASHPHDLTATLSSGSNDELAWSPSAARTPNQSTLAPFPGTPASADLSSSAAVNATEHARRTSVSDLLTDRVPLTPTMANGGATLLTPSSAAAATVSDGDKGDKGSDYNLLFGAVEARWILTVLDDCVKKLDTVSWLHPDLLKDKAAMAIADPVSYETIKDHFRVRWIHAWVGCLLLR
jgi:hypothetical protein